MIRYFLIFILLKSILFACSLCSIYTPRTHVTTQIRAAKEYIKKVAPDIIDKEGDKLNIMLDRKEVQINK